MASLPPVLPLTQPMNQNRVQIQIRPRPSDLHIIPYFLHNSDHVQPQKHPNQNHIGVRARRTQPILLHPLKHPQSTLSILPPSILLKEAIIRGGTWTHSILHHLLKQPLCILKPPTRSKTLNNRGIRHHIGKYPFLLH